MKKLLFVLGLLIALTGGILFSQTSVQSVHADPKASPTPTPTPLKVTICHWDNGQGGKYTQNNININSVNDCTGAAGHDGHSSDIIPSYDYGSCHYNGKNLSMVSWIANNCTQPVVDQCSNIDGVQATVPAGDYQSNGQCFPKTPVCDDPNAVNYGGADHTFNSTTETANNDLCQYDLCPNLSGVQTSVPDDYVINNDGQCVKQDPCAHQDNDEDEDQDDSACVTPTVTPSVTPTPTLTPTPTTTTGGGSTGGDGLSDGLGCSTHDCSNHPSSGSTAVLGASTGPEQAVLGASTMAGTGTFENTIMNVMLLAGTIILGAGLKSYAKEKKN